MHSWSKDQWMSKNSNLIFKSSPFSFRDFSESRRYVSILFIFYEKKNKQNKSKLYVTFMERQWLLPLYMYIERRFHPPISRFAHVFIFKKYSPVESTCTLYIIDTYFCWPKKVARKGLTREKKKSGETSVYYIFCIRLHNLIGSTVLIWKISHVVCIIYLCYKASY